VIVCVTGAAGFLGRRVVSQLIARGDAVHMLSRAQGSGALPPHANLHVHRYDDPSQLETVLTGVRPDAVIHLAAASRPAERATDIAPTIEVNVTLGVQVLHAAAVAGARSFVHAGSWWEGALADGPATLYAAAKRGFREIVAYYSARASMPATTLWVYDTYGPDDTRKKFIGLLVDAWKRGAPLPASHGLQRLDFVHVDDAARAFVMATDRAVASDQPAVEGFAVRSGVTRSLRDVVASAERALGAPLRVEWGAVPAKNETLVPPEWPILPGWAPAIDFEAGLRDCFR
jgi:nucleoside-diphosphate-sugar epimerase